VRAKIQESKVIVRIQDKGQGIPNELLNSVKNGKTVTTKSHGNGIGLLSAYQWARKEGYDLNVISRIQQPTIDGTDISISIPLDHLFENLHDSIEMETN
jgi:sensor histidine kinase regulating citrate/malate metabolism